MKNSADLGGCYPTRPSASVDNTLLDLQNSSYPTQSHSIIANNFDNQVKTTLTQHKIPLLLSITYFWEDKAKETCTRLTVFHGAAYSSCKMNLFSRKTKEIITVTEVWRNLILIGFERSYFSVDSLAISIGPYIKHDKQC